VTNQLHVPAALPEEKGQRSKLMGRFGDDSVMPLLGIEHDLSVDISGLVTVPTELSCLSRWIVLLTNMSSNFQSDTTVYLLWLSCMFRSICGQHQAVVYNF
jgi:hypothetical protein